MSVIELGYVGLEVSDLAAWREFATEVIGLQFADEGEDGSARLRMDYWNRRINLHHGPSDDLAYFGFRVADGDALLEMAKKLEKAGYEFEFGSSRDEDNRAVMGLLKMLSPGGTPMEIFWGPQVDSHDPFYPGRAMHGRFRTGSRGLGHIAVREPQSAYEFFKLIGLKGGPEYKLNLGNGIVAKPIFMHCNERQHSFQFDLGPMAKRINHLMIEYDNVDDVGLVHDLVRRKEIDVAMHLGKHANDHALSFYVATPSKWLMELGSDVRDTPTHAEYSRADLFGHGLGALGYGLDGIDVSGH